MIPRYNFFEIFFCKWFAKGATTSLNRRWGIFFFTATRSVAVDACCALGRFAR